ERTANLALLEELCDTMVGGSLCALGGMAPFPVRSALRHFRTDFERESAVEPVGAAHAGDTGGRPRTIEGASQ
ncbi:MAG TPA: NADH-ubiquinone oxidoreductase-F iron-sulfur binding region domain-containing protein, partial [Thermomicrobiales bacterium]|nr:NADH-ubiquinone oxidoreductase-F iron-sulfur binding region domain-containing protein [Thermomicrobiales bacterium]